MKECTICCENKKNNYTCEECNFNACKDCWMSFFKENISSYQQEIQCMNQSCKRPFRNRVLYTNFAHKFIDEYNELRSELLYQVEKSKFHRYTDAIESYYATMKLVEEFNYIKKKENERLQKITDIINKYVSRESRYLDLIYHMFTTYNYKPNKKTLRICANYSGYSADGKYGPIEDDIFNKLLKINNLCIRKNKDDEIEKVIQIFKSIFNSFELEDIRQLLILRNKIYTSTFVNKEIKTIQLKIKHIKLNGVGNRKRDIIHFCFNKDCPGILSERDQCSSCNSLCCIKCNHISMQTEEHKCKEEDLMLTKLLSKSRRCPKCKEMITKSFGCDVMWCTLCHTHFDYRTGDFIRTGNLHNPEFIEYLNSIGQTYTYQLEVEYDNVMNEFALEGYNSNKNWVNILFGINQQKVINDITRFFNDFFTSHADRVLNNYSINRKVDQEIPWNIIFNHLIGRIDKEEFKKRIKKYHKIKIAWSDYKEIIFEFMKKGKILYNTHLIKNRDEKTFFALFDDLVKEYNELLNTTRKIYGNVNPMIHFDPNNNTDYKFTIYQSSQYTF